MRVFIVSLLTALGVLLPAYAANWVRIGGNNETTILMDFDTFSRHGAVAKMWVKWLNLRPQVLRNSYSQETYSYVLEYKIFNCANGTMASAQEIVYSDSDGRRVLQDSKLEESQWRFSAPVPETGNELLYNYACPKTMRR